MNGRLFSQAIGVLGDKYYMEAAAYQPRREKRPGLRLVTRIVIAAALLLALSITAYAAYQVLLKDYFVTSQTLTDAIREDMGGELSPRATISMVGYQGTAEYAAYTEWESWLAKYYAEHPRNNSTWHETPDNYCYYYNAFYQAQAEKLDEIITKYGVRLHESRASADAEEVYAMLGTEPFLADAYGGGSGYIYNDGTFSLDFNKFQGDVCETGSIFLSVKGTVTMISATIDPTEDYEEWSYQTASGPVVDLVLTGLNAHIFYETGSAYIHVGSQRLDWSQAGGNIPHTRQSLQALADNVNFGTLARVFDDGASFDLSQALVEQEERNEQKAQQRNERQRQGMQRDYDISLEVLQKLGVYGPVPLPEGYARSPHDWPDLDKTDTIYGAVCDGFQTEWGGTVIADRVIAAFGNAATGEGLELYYTRYYTDESRTASATAEKFEAARAYYGAFEGFQPCQVNGCPGFYYPETHDSIYGTIFDPGVMWLDGEHDLLFVLDMQDYSYFDPQTGQIVHSEEPFTPDELIALAATVTAE